MAQQWQVPGFVLDEMLGFGGLGEVWRACDAGGEQVVLRRVGVVEPATLREVRRAATVVRSLPSRHLVRLRRSLVVEDEEVLVLDHADGGSLATMLAARGRLTAGEVVTAVAPLAEALAQAHAFGLAHGRLGLTSVLLRTDGMPVLDGLGLAVLHDGDDVLPPSPAADVSALGALCHQLLTGETHTGGGTVPGPLSAVVDSALAADPTCRPTAADFGAALLAACPARPLRGHPAPVPVALAPRRLRPLGAAAVALLVVVGAGWSWGSHSSEKGAVLTAGPDWRGLVDGLDAQRARAFAQADARLLDQVWVARSVASRADALSIGALAAGRRTAVGVRHQVTQARPPRVTAERVELAVVEQLGAQDVLESGRVVQHRSAGAPTRCTVVLVRTPAGWRLGGVLAVLR